MLPGVHDEMPEGIRVRLEGFVQRSHLYEIRPGSDNTEYGFQSGDERCEVM
jgi:hypothetical protein